MRNVLTQSHQLRYEIFLIGLAIVLTDSQDSRRVYFSCSLTPTVSLWELTRNPTSIRLMRSAFLHLMLGDFFSRIIPIAKKYIWTPIGMGKIWLPEQSFEVKHKERPSSHHYRLSFSPLFISRRGEVNLAHFTPVREVLASLTITLKGLTAIENIWCFWKDLNLHSKGFIPIKRMILSHLCMPIPPQKHCSWWRESTSFWKTCQV